MTTLNEAQLLLAAAPQVAHELKLEQFTPERIAQIAGLGADAFARAFPSVEHYVDAVHLRFMEAILQRQIAELGHLRPGMERIHKATNLQLDICLEQRAVRQLLAEARRRLPRVIETLGKRNRGTMMMISLELKALGCPQAMPMARIYCMMVLEAADVEADAGGAIPELRTALADFLTRTVPARSSTAAAVP